MTHQELLDEKKRLKDIIGTRRERNATEGTLGDFYDVQTQIDLRDAVALLNRGGRLAVAEEK